MRLESLRSKLEADTGQAPTLARIDRLSEYLRRWKLSPDQVKIVSNLDRGWSERDGRTPLERRAEIIGASGPAGERYVWWVVPQVSVE